MTEIALGRGGARSATEQRPIAAPKLDEGWTTFALHLLLIIVTANSVLRVEQGDRTAVLIPLAIGGLLLGRLVARTPSLDSISHLLALGTGLLAALTLSAVRFSGIGELWSSRGRVVYDLADRLISAQVNVGTSRLSDDDLLVVIGLTLWLVGYSSAWMLYRRHWLMPAILTPAVLVFINLRFDDAEPTASLAVFAVAAMVMAARHHVFVRQLEWNRMRVPSPSGLSRRFTACASVMVVASILAGWALPFQAPDGLVDNLADKAQQQVDWATRQWQRVAGGQQRDGFTSDIYTTFSDSFKIGGEFTPSDSEVATLEAASPTYLAVRRYDVYNGHGWSSGVVDTFRMSGDSDDVDVTSITFLPNNPVQTSDEVNFDREPRAGVVTVLQAKNHILFTTDTFSSSSVSTEVILGWTQLAGTTIDINDVDVKTLPVDLHQLVQMLRSAEFSPDPDNGRPMVVNGTQSQAIEHERARLLLYPIETALTYNGDGDVILTVSGRLPNYDDIEAVFENRETTSSRYRVIGTASVASTDELSEAGTDYPDWITARYLQLPTTITDETAQLAAQVASDAGAVTPFDKAWAIQEYLHTNYEYALNSEAAPSDRDAVDFFLFDKKIGRCEDYATAMVVMLRSQGIPARLVAGYRSGDETDQFGDFVYREKQAHTWVEVYFPKYGWVPFEPTKGQAPFDYGQKLEPEATQVALQPEISDPTPTPLPEATAEATPEVAPVFNSTDSSDEGGTWKDKLNGGLALLAVAATGLSVILVLLFVVIWAWGLRGMRPGAALFAKTMRIGKLWGIEPDPTMTPGEYALEFGRAVPRAGGAVRYVADLYSAETYGGIEISEEAKRGGNQAWHAVRSGVLSWRPWRKRRRMRERGF